MHGPFSLGAAFLMAVAWRCNAPSIEAIGGQNARLSCGQAALPISCFVLDIQSIQRRAHVYATGGEVARPDKNVTKRRLSFGDPTG
jgi:hypothetical protein